MNSKDQIGWVREDSAPPSAFLMKAFKVQTCCYEWLLIIGALSREFVLNYFSTAKECSKAALSIMHSTGKLDAQPSGFLMQLRSCLGESQLQRQFSACQLESPTELKFRRLERQTSDRNRQVYLGAWQSQDTLTPAGLRPLSSRTTSWLHCFSHRRPSVNIR